jgi:hypothetical protein
MRIAIAGRSSRTNGAVVALILLRYRKKKSRAVSTAFSY